LIIKEWLVTYIKTLIYNKYNIFPNITKCVQKSRKTKISLIMEWETLISILTLQTCHSDPWHLMAGFSSSPPSKFHFHLRLRNTSYFLPLPIESSVQVPGKCNICCCCCCRAGDVAAVPAMLLLLLHSHPIHGGLCVAGCRLLVSGCWLLAVGPCYDFPFCPDFHIPPY